MSKINVLGASCIDILVDHIDSKTFLSGKYKADRIKTSFGGDALNEAVVLSYLKEDVSISTVIADDPMGVLIQNFLETKGITVSNPIKQNVETYLSLVLIDENGERHFIGSKNGSLRSYCLEDVCIDEDCKIVSFASMFISPLFDDEQMGKLFSLIKEKGILLCVDCSSIKN
ncbi:MAG: carbohydrate kinase family protein, partial [Erysipelotrichaceae bacterium]|nr:carbohydrate kinase family protein [Erysipelotrichaceae bacterium]